MYPKPDSDLVDWILELLIAYRRAGARTFLSVGIELEDQERIHPLEYARAERLYYEQFAPRKERLAYAERRKTEKRSKSNNR